MTGKTEELFKFLAQNRDYNKNLQERYYRSIILPCKTEKEKIISLLYHIANTQSQPKIDLLACSYKSIISEKSSYSLSWNLLKKSILAATAVTRVFTEE
ncbi:hypothetical protein B0A80_16915 [Flavobacterium tructae]|nr:hypothetical protein B0A80_16915 [Flavobacterium tructae]